jgi:hypothetical protein
MSGFDDWLDAAPASAPEAASDSSPGGFDGWLGSNAPAVASPSTATEDRATRAPQGGPPPVPPMNGWSMGAGDVAGGLAQSLTHGLAWAGQKVAPDSQFTKDATKGASDIDARIAQVDAAYDAQRQAAMPPTLSGLVTGDKEKPGVDWPRLAAAGGLSAPMLAFGPEFKGLSLLQKLALGTAQGSVGGAIAPTNVAPGDTYAGEKAKQIGLGGALGAGMPALLSGVPKAVKGVSNALAPVINPRAYVGKGLAGSMDPAAAAAAADAIRNAPTYVDGSMPTSAQVAQNVGLVQTEKALANKDVGFKGQLAERGIANDAARYSAADSVVGANLPVEQQNFLAAQQQRVTNGQVELPPVSDAQAALMQTPAYKQGMQKARDLASNAQNSVFDNQTASINTGLANDLNSTVGTPETLAALRTARGATAADDYLSTHVGIPLDDPGMVALMKTPAMRTALKAAGDSAANRQQGGILTTVQNRANANLGGAVGTPQQYVSGRALVAAKKNLDDQIGHANSSSQPGIAGDVSAVKDQLVTFLKKNIPGYEQASSNYAAASVPIDQQAALQQRLVGAVNPLTGQANPSTLAAAINSITAAQAKNGLSAADKVTPELLAQVRALGQRAQQAPSNLTGLSGQGQEFMRQGLGVAGSDAAPAFDQYLSANSPSYAKFVSEAGTTGKDLEARAALNDALATLRGKALGATEKPQMLLTSASTAFAKANLTGQAKTVADNILKDLQRTTVSNAVRSGGSDTAYNNTANGWLARTLYGPTFGGATQTAKVLGSGATALAGHPFAAAGVYAGMNKLGSTVGGKLNAALGNYLLNPDTLLPYLDAHAASTARNPQTANALSRLMQNYARPAVLGGLLTQ